MNDRAKLLLPRATPQLLRSNQLQNYQLNTEDRKVRRDSCEYCQTIPTTAESGAAPLPSKRIAGESSTVITKLVGLGLGLMEPTESGGLSHTTSKSVGNVVTCC